MDALTFIAAVIYSFFGALFLLGPCGIELDDCSSEKEKKVCTRINQVLFVIYLLAILYLLLCTNGGPHLLKFLMGPLAN